MDEQGNICLDILKEKWSSAYTVSTILQSLRSLLGGESPLPTPRVRPEITFSPMLQRSSRAPCFLWTDWWLPPLVS